SCQRTAFSGSSKAGDAWVKVDVSAVGTNGCVVGRTGRVQSVGIHYDQIHIVLYIGFYNVPIPPCIDGVPVSIVGRRVVLLLCIPAPCVAGAGTTCKITCSVGYVRVVPKELRRDGNGLSRSYFR